MEILSKNHSSYPRVGNDPEQQRLRRAYNQYDKGKLTAEEVAQILDETVIEIIDEQAETGCSLVTDGQIRAYDPLSHIAGKIDGFEITGLLRFFDTNYLYRQPLVTGKLSRRESLVADEFKFIEDRVNGKASAVLFGPYSLLKMSNCESDFEMRIRELVEIYKVELSELKNAGCNLVQLDEPAIIHNSGDLGLMESAYKELVKDKDRPSVLLAFYFGNATPYVDKLAELPVDGLVFDFIYSPGLDSLLEGFSRDVGLGIMDGRNTKMENFEQVAKRIEKLIGKLKSDKIYVTSSCGLEFLPRDRAFNKLKLCADIAGELAGGSR
jgi:5-methyltetrahydropteroyltriglutamate--homocysteine methyltransferase